MNLTSALGFTLLPMPMPLAAASIGIDLALPLLLLRGAVCGVGRGGAGVLSGPLLLPTMASLRSNRAARFAFSSASSRSRSTLVLLLASLHANRSARFTMAPSPNCRSSVEQLRASALFPSLLAPDLACSETDAPPVPLLSSAFSSSKERTRTPLTGTVCGAGDGGAGAMLAPLLPSSLEQAPCGASLSMEWPESLVSSTRSSGRDLSQACAPPASSKCAFADFATVLLELPHNEVHESLLQVCTAAAALAKAVTGNSDARSQVS
eukprot:scaffold7042_cov60-Phaeocystis_antarctica.AAC.4